MSAIRYGTSPWLDGAGATRRPTERLRGQLECDVAIVGGGLAGCVAAFVFAHAGVRTMLLEADRIGRGATAGAPGLLDPGTGARLCELRERHGLRAARHMREASRRAGLELQALVRRLGITCGLERSEILDAAMSNAEAQALEQEYRLLTESGFDAVWLTGQRARSATGLPAQAALKRAGVATADPYRLALGFASHAGRIGAGVFEGSEVRRIRIGRGGVTLTGAQGSVAAQAVLIATDLPQPDLRALHRHLRGVVTTGALVPSVPPPIRRALSTPPRVVRDAADPPHAWRLDRRGALVLWQHGQPPIASRQRDAATLQRTGQLMYEFSVLHPAVSGVQPSHRWISTSHRSQDGLVVAGAHRAFPQHLFAAGLGVDGLHGAYLAARLNLRHYLGSAEKGDELFGFVR